MCPHTTIPARIFGVLHALLSARPSPAQTTSSLRPDTFCSWRPFSLCTSCSPATVCVLILLYITTYGSSYYYICVLITVYHYMSVFVSQDAPSWMIDSSTYKNKWKEHTNEKNDVRTYKPNSKHVHAGSLRPHKLGIYSIQYKPKWKHDQNPTFSLHKFFVLSSYTSH